MHTSGHCEIRMKTRKIRCYETLANVYPGIYNYPVYYLNHDGWSDFSLATCINCGELFVIDWEDPLKEGLSLTEIANALHCPTCNSFLKETIRNYPETIRLTNGKIGSYIPDTYITSDDQSLVKEIYEITLNK